MSASYKNRCTKTTLAIILSSNAQNRVFFISHISELYLKLEDVTKRFVRPCIMDVKMGKRSYDPFASLEKREEQISKYPLMEEIGFLLLGMRVRQHACVIC